MHKLKNEWISKVSYWMLEFDLKKYQRELASIKTRELWVIWRNRKIMMIHDYRESKVLVQANRNVLISKRVIISLLNDYMWMKYNTFKMYLLF